MRHILLIIPIILLLGCGGDSGDATPQTENPDPDSIAVNDLTLDFTRHPESNTTTVTAHVIQNGLPLSGATLTVEGNSSGVTDSGNGDYSFTVSLPAVGEYPVSVTAAGLTVTRTLLQMATVNTGSYQPLAVPGDFVNTEGYEDGITITPYGEYLFVQYGPVYFSGIIFISTICNDTAYAIGYNLNDCENNASAEWVFTTKGPYDGLLRPDFPAARISDGNLSHISALVDPGTANGLFVPPTIFYGFKRQSDGTFAEPFAVKFDETPASGVQSPYGLSFLPPEADGTVEFLVAWNNNEDNLSDDGADIYRGTMTLGQPYTLGTVTGDATTHLPISINPTGVSPITSPAPGVQGNPHIHADANGLVHSVWTDDEVSSHDLSLYLASGGTYPDGVTWVYTPLPDKINTAEEESQPFFTGSRLYLRRLDAVVYHEFNTSADGNYSDPDNWGDAVTLLQTPVTTAQGAISAVGEPTLAVRDDGTYLYFVYGKVRTNLNGLPDFNMDAGFVRLPD